MAAEHEQARAVPTQQAITVTLPRAVMPWGQERIDVPRPAPAPPADMSGDVIRILYIEDNPANIEVVTRFLRSATNVVLHAAKTGEAGLEAAVHDHPDLILLDNRLPDSSGLQVLLQLAASPATAAVPVVVLSGDSGQAMVKDLLAAGASGFLAKPFAVGELLAIIAHHLG